MISPIDFLNHRPFGSTLASTLAFYQALLEPFPFRRKTSFSSYHFRTQTHIPTCFPGLVASPLSSFIHIPKSQYS